MPDNPFDTGKGQHGPEEDLEHIDIITQPSPEVPDEDAGCDSAGGVSGAGASCDGSFGVVSGSLLSSLPESGSDPPELSLPLPFF